MFSLRSISLIAAIGLCHFSALANEPDDIKQQLAALKAQIAALEQRLAEQEAATEKTAVTQATLIEQTAAASDAASATRPSVATRRDICEGEIRKPCVHSDMNSPELKQGTECLGRV